MELGYYTYLARTVPKRELARAIAVRARRALGRKAPAVAPPAERRKRALYAMSEARPGIVDPAEREFSAQLLRERWPAEAARVMEDATRARRGELPLFGQWKTCFKQGTSEIDYHRDPLAPWVKYDPAQPGDQVVLFQPGADARVMWEVGRLQQLWRFAQARWLARTGAERSEWARAWIDCVRQFRTSNPAGLGVQWSCAMEVAFRATHVALTFAYIQDDEVVDEAFAGELLDMLEEHCAYIEAHLEETGAVRTNHYAADLVGLVVVGALFPELGRSPHWAPNI
jgi:hypothetical protein